MSLRAHTIQTQPELQFTSADYYPTIYAEGREECQFSSIDADMINAQLGILIPRSFPARHNLHKYWGKKPANIFSTCVSFFSKKGELILDPFCGSGVTVIESIILGRKAIGLDLNPFAVFLTETLLRGNQ